MKRLMKSQTFSPFLGMSRLSHHRTANRCHEHAHIILLFSPSYLEPSTWRVRISFYFYLSPRNSLILSINPLAMASRFEKLPVEVLCSIILLLRKPELYNLSIVSKALSETACKAFAADVALYPNDKSVSRFCHLASTPRLADEVRSVYIYTSNAPYVSYH